MKATCTAELFAPIQEGLAVVETRLREAPAGQHAALAAATEHLLKAGGKRIRPALCLLSAGIFGADPERSVSLAAAIEMLHTATLIHDDLVDGALMRRGVPTLSAERAPDVVVLMGDYLFARAAGLLAETDDLRILQLSAGTLMTIINGEIQQKYARGHISREDYYERIYAKTAALFVLCAEAAAILGSADQADQEALAEFGRAVGMAYQIVDDVLDFVGTPDQTGKPAGSDLRQGLFTLPAIYYCESHPDDPDMRALLQGRGQEDGVIPQVVSAVRASGAIEAALSEAHAFAARAQLTLANIPDSPYATALSALAHYVVDRDM